MSGLGINGRAQGCSEMMDLEGAEAQGTTELSAGIKQLQDGPSCAFYRGGYSYESPWSVAMQEFTVA